MQSLKNIIFNIFGPVGKSFKRNNPAFSAVMNLELNIIRGVTEIPVYFRDIT